MISRTPAIAITIKGSICNVKNLEVYCEMARDGSGS